MKAETEGRLTAGPEISLESERRSFSPSAFSHLILRAGTFLSLLFLSFYWLNLLTQTHLDLQLIKSRDNLDNASSSLVVTGVKGDGVIFLQRTQVMVCVSGDRGHFRKRVSFSTAVIFSFATFPLPRTWHSTLDLWSCCFTDGVICALDCARCWKRTISPRD